MEPANRSSFATEKGVDINAEAAEEKTPGTGENTEYLYAVVDKANKKKKQPQVILIIPHKLWIIFLCNLVSPAASDVDGHSLCVFTDSLVHSCGR